MHQQKRGCSLAEVNVNSDVDAAVAADEEEDKTSVSSRSSSNLKQAVVKLRKLPSVLPVAQSTTPASTNKKYDFNSIAVVRVKRLWNALPCEKPGTNLLPNGVVKNTKRMRFQTKVLTLEDED